MVLIPPGLCDDYSNSRCHRGSAPAAYPPPDAYGPCACWCHTRLPHRSRLGRRRVEREVAAAFDAHRHDADAALLAHDVRRTWPTPRMQPSCAASQRWVAREGHLARGREDSHPVVSRGVARRQRGRSAAAARWAWMSWSQGQPWTALGRSAAAARVGLSVSGSGGIGVQRHRKTVS